GPGFLRRRRSDRSTSNSFTSAAAPMREFPELLPCPTTPRAVRAYLEFAVSAGQALGQAWFVVAGELPAVRDAARPRGRAPRARKQRARKGRRRRLSPPQGGPPNPTSVGS